MSPGCDFNQLNKLSRFPETRWKIKLIDPWILPSIFLFTIEQVLLNSRFVWLFFIFVVSFWSQHNFPHFGKLQQSVHLNVRARPHHQKTMSLNVVFLCWKQMYLLSEQTKTITVIEYTVAGLWGNRGFKILMIWPDYLSYGYSSNLD